MQFFLNRCLRCLTTQTDILNCRSIKCDIYDCRSIDIDLILIIPPPYFLRLCTVINGSKHHEIISAIEAVGILHTVPPPNRKDKDFHNFEKFLRFYFTCQDFVYEVASFPLLSKMMLRVSVYNSRQQCTMSN